MQKSRFLLLLLGLVVFLSWSEQEWKSVKIEKTESEINKIQRDLDKANTKLEEAREKQGWFRTKFLDTKEVDELEENTKVLQDKITKKKKDLTTIELASAFTIPFFFCAFLIYRKLSKRSRNPTPSNNEDTRWAQNKKKSGEKRWKAQVERLGSLLNYDLLIIDSNIWMNTKYEGFFETLKSALIKSGKTMTLLGPQFDEICNIKLKTKYEEPRNASARYAIKKIEAFQRENLLNIVSAAKEPDRHAYADPVILKLITANARNGKSIVFITNDRELRVQARQVLKDASKVDYELVEIDTDFAELF